MRRIWAVTAREVGRTRAALTSSPVDATRRHDDDTTIASSRMDPTCCGFYFSHLRLLIFKCGKLSAGHCRTRLCPNQTLPKPDPVQFISHQLCYQHLRAYHVELLHFHEPNQDTPQSMNGGSNYASYGATCGNLCLAEPTAIHDFAKISNRHRDTWN